MKKNSILPYQQISVDFMIVNSETLDGFWFVTWIEKDSNEKISLQSRSFDKGYLAAVFVGELTERFSSVCNKQLENKNELNSTKTVSFPSLMNDEPKPDTNITSTGRHLIRKFAFDQYVEHGGPVHIETICRKLNLPENTLLLELPSAWRYGKFIVPDHAAITREIAILHREVEVMRDGVVS